MWSMCAPVVEHVTVGEDVIRVKYVSEMAGTEVWSRLMRVVPRISESVPVCREFCVPGYFYIVSGVKLIKRGVYIYGKYYQ